jgi:hypothetical protein
MLHAHTIMYNSPPLPENMPVRAPIRRPLSDAHPSRRHRSPQNTVFPVSLTKKSADAVVHATLLSAASLRSMLAAVPVVTPGYAQTRHWSRRRMFAGPAGMHGFIAGLHRPASPGAGILPAPTPPARASSIRCEALSSIHCPPRTVDSALAAMRFSRDRC